MLLYTLQSDQACQYSYTADQQHGDDTSNAVFASATVDIICQSGKIFYLSMFKYYEFSHQCIHVPAVGSFDGTIAKHFCMQISDAQIQGTVIGDDPTKANE